MRTCSLVKKAQRSTPRQSIWLQRCKCSSLLTNLCQLVSVLARTIGSSTWILFPGWVATLSQWTRTGSRSVIYKTWTSGTMSTLLRYGRLWVHTMNLVRSIWFLTTLWTFSRLLLRRSLSVIRWLRAWLPLLIERPRKVTQIQRISAHNGFDDMRFITTSWSWSYGTPCKVVSLWRSVSGWYCGKTLSVRMCRPWFLRC